MLQDLVNSLSSSSSSSSAVDDALPPGLVKYRATAVATFVGDSETRLPGNAKFMAMAKSVLAEPTGELHEEAGPSWSRASGTSSVDGLWAAFVARLLQRFLARLGPGDGDESEEENSSVDPVEWDGSQEETSWRDSVVWDESEKDDWAAVARWLSADGHLNYGCRACRYADGS